MRHKFLALVICIIFYLPLSIQASIIPEETDSITLKEEIIPLKKNYGLAAAQTAGINIAIWAFDKYALKADYANISLNSMKTNLTNHPVWDNDHFSTNLFGHPYHGALYYNSARANGMDYVESALYTFGGSLMWEFFMELERPSINDLIMTTAGGIKVGEILFRSSDLILDNRASGTERFGREALGFLISPGRGLTRLLTGDAWRIRGNSGKQFYTPDLNFSLSMGIKAMELRNFDIENNVFEEIFDSGVGIAIDAKMEYGDVMDYDDNSPYSYFSARLDLNLQKNQPIIGQINLLGKLWNTPVVQKERHRLNFGVYQHLDYYDSDTLINRKDGTKGMQAPYVVGSPASFGLGLLYDGNFFKDKNKLSLKAQLHVNAMLLGATLTDYFRAEDRNYNFGSGYSIKQNLDLRYRNFSLNFDNSLFHIFTWQGYDPELDLSSLKEEEFKLLNVQGDKSRAMYYIMGTTLGYNFNPKWSIYYQRFDFFRKTNYSYLPDVYSNTSDGRLMVRFNF